MVVCARERLHTACAHSTRAVSGLKSGQPAVISAPRAPVNIAPMPRFGRGPSHILLRRVTCCINTQNTLFKTGERA